MTDTGKVKFFDPAKGYGFIRRDDGGPDLYVHQRGLSHDAVLLPGEPVAFETAIDRSGRTFAKDVRSSVSPVEKIRAMNALRKSLDHDFRGRSEANETLTDLRHLLTELEQFAATA